MGRHFQDLNEAKEAIQERIELSEVEREILYRGGVCFCLCTYRTFFVKKEKEVALKNLLSELDSLGDAFSSRDYRRFIAEQQKTTPRMFFGLFKSRTKEVCEGVFELVQAKHC
tara:strand:- start:25 stop:363 length:339 start_codon:yes stop_codon:yes gene_type:complete